MIEKDPEKPQLKPGEDKVTTRLHQSPEAEYETGEGIQTDYLKKEDLEKTQKDLEKVKKNLEETQKDLKQSKTSIVESIGIFVAIFTFISINFQIIQAANDVEKAISLILILLGAILILLTTSIIMLRIDENIKNLFKKIFYFPLLGIILTCVGIYLIIRQENNFKTYDSVKCITDKGEEIGPAEIASVEGQVISIKLGDIKVPFYFRQCQKEKLKK